MNKAVIPFEREAVDCNRQGKQPRPPSMGVGLFPDQAYLNEQRYVIMESFCRGNSVSSLTKGRPTLKLKLGTGMAAAGSNRDI